MRATGLAVIPRDRRRDGRARTSSSPSTPASSEMIIIEMNPPPSSQSNTLASRSRRPALAKIATRSWPLGYTLERDHKRHPRETPASPQAVDRLRRRQGPPRFAFEKFPGADGELGHTDEVVRARSWRSGAPSRRPGQGRQLQPDRPLGPGHEAVPSSPSSSAASVRPGPGAAMAARRAMRAGLLHERGGLRAPARIDPWFPRAASRTLVDEDEGHARRGRRAGRQAARRRANTCDASAACRTGASPEGDGHVGGAGAPGAPTASPIFSASTRAPPSSRPRRRTCTRRTDGPRRRRSTASPSSPVEQGAADRQEEDRHPGRRAQPRRSGHRVRLLLRPRRAGYLRKGRLRDDHDQWPATPRTVSTDYDTADRLYFEPLSARGRARDPRRREADGRDRQFGADAAAHHVPLQNAGVKLLGTSADAIDRAEESPALRRPAQEARSRRPPEVAHGLGGARDRRSRQYPSWCGPRTSSARGRSSTSPRASSTSCTALAGPRAAEISVVARRRGGRAHPHRPVPA